MAVPRCSAHTGTLLLWALAGLFVIRSATMQYMLTSSRSSATSTVTAHRGGERRSQAKVGMACEGAGASAQGPPGLWGTFTLKEVVPTVAIFGTLAMIMCSSFSPAETQRSARMMHSIPLTGATASVRKSIERFMPNQAQRYKDQQQGLITSLGLVVPFAVGALQTSGALPTHGKETA